MHWEALRAHGPIMHPSSTAVHQAEGQVACFSFCTPSSIWQPEANPLFAAFPLCKASKIPNPNTRSSILPVFPGHLRWYGRPVRQLGDRNP